MSHHEGRVAVVTDRDSLVTAAQRVHDELGGADVLVNNAATKWGLNEVLLRPAGQA